MVGNSCTVSTLGRAVLWPTLPRLPEAEREDFLKAMIRRFATIKWTGVTVVAVTGVFQWYFIWPRVSDKTLYVIYFTVKMIGAIGLFSITFLLALPTEKLKGMQSRRAFWSGLNILCGLTILIGAALMRSVTKINP